MNQALLKSRQQLVLENLALRQQAAVLRRGVKRPKRFDQDRVFWKTMLRLRDSSREAPHIVQSDTVAREHRRSYRHYWRRRSKPKRICRPIIAWELVHLIKRLSRENLLWGALRISDELAMLGHAVGETTVGKYRGRHPGFSTSEFNPLAALRRYGRPFRQSVGELCAHSLVSSGSMTNRLALLGKGAHPLSRGCESGPVHTIILFLGSFSGRIDHGQSREEALMRPIHMLFLAFLVSCTLSAPKDPSERTLADVKRVAREHPEILERSPDPRPLAKRVEAAKALLSEALEEQDPAIRLAKLEDAKKLAPEADMPHYWLGRAYLYAGRSLEAEEQFRKALLINPAFVEAHERLSTILMRRGEWSDAESILLTGLSKVDEARRTDLVPELKSRLELVASLGDSEHVPLSEPEHVAIGETVAGSVDASEELPDKVLSISGLSKVLASGLRGGVRSLPPTTADNMNLKAALAVLDLVGLSEQATGDDSSGRALLGLALDLLAYAHRDDPDALLAFAPILQHRMAPDDALDHSLAMAVNAGLPATSGGVPADLSTRQWGLRQSGHPVDGQWNNGGTRGTIQVEGNQLVLEMGGRRAGLLGKTTVWTLQGHTATLGMDGGTWTMDFASDWRSAKCRHSWGQSWTARWVGR